ncbi:MAG: MBL fold metallo-hydrolase [Eubacteriales bacterium]|nr:MBL fold metallo-hydrolase [Eubacteriales bacterium]
MKLTFIGADHEVTGSQHLLETADLKILIDCGLEQGENVYENAELPVNYSEIDYIILTHAHIDHAGMIPFACKMGFNGTIVTTNASMDLDSIMLLDSAHIQEQEAEWQNRKGMRAGKKPVEPLYTVEDAKAAIRQFRSVPYNRVTELSDTVKLRFVDAGHLLGSASAEIWITEGELKKKIVFSGDIGNQNKPLIRDPQYIAEADYVVMESTYGNRHHDMSVDHLEDLRRIVQETLDRGGNVVIPAFAVGRTQELLYLLRHLKQERLIRGHEGFPVYVDSPLAVQATHVFRENLLECYDDETRALVEQGINPIEFDNLCLSVSADDSKAINFDPEPKVILAASGMCDAGRIRHHLKHNLWRPECTVVFAGYQAEGTLGRMLQDGAETVRIFGEEIEVRAKIEQMGSMSSHADQTGLLQWISAFTKQPDALFLVHGNDEAMTAFSALLLEKPGIKPHCPYSGSVFDLATGRFEYEAEPRFIRREKAVSVRNNTVRQELALAAEAVRQLSEELKTGTNADMKRFTKELRNLLARWK